MAACQRGHIEERPNGTYRATVYAGIDPLTGRSRYLKKTVPTEAQAKIDLTPLQNEVDEQRHPRSAITVGQVIDKWLEVVKLEDTTCQRYDGLTKLYLRERFGPVPAGRLDAETLERFYARLQRCSKLCGSNSKHECKPLSASSVRQIHFILARPLTARSVGAISA